MKGTSLFPAKYRYELANELGISLSTFARRLNEKHVVIPRGVLSPQHQMKVYEALGYPNPGLKKAFAEVGLTDVTDSDEK